jgi:hypothetical protein
MAKKSVPPLVLEEVQDRANYLYLTLIEYKKERYLTIVDNISGSDISVFVLDYAKAENVDMNWLLSVANIWYYKSSEKYPLSFEFAKLGAKNKITPIMRIDAKPKIKRKRVNVIPSSVEIKLKKNPIIIKSGQDVDYVNE